MDIQKARIFESFYRFAEVKADRLPELTKELVSLGALVIVTNGSASIRAAHNAAPSVPIVSWASGDPMIMGWAHTLARPGGMITGLFVFITAAKPFELLKELRPEATKFGCLMHASNPANPHAKKLVEDAGRAHGFNVEFIELKEESELADAFGRMRSLRAEGIVALPDVVLGSSAAAIAELARLHRLPSVGDGHPFVNAGGLFAFWVNLSAMAKHSAWYVDSILRGAHPGDLPAEQATEFKLLVNMKTAKELGLTIPTAILARADEVIE